MIFGKKLRLLGLKKNKSRCKIVSDKIPERLKPEIRINMNNVMT